VRLDSDPQVDLQVGIFAAGGEPLRAAAMVAAMPPGVTPPEWGDIGTLFTSWGTAGTIWHDAIHEVWLEFDLAHAPVAPAVPAVPAVFVSLVPGDRAPDRDVQRTFQLVEHFGNTPLPEATRTCLRHVVETAAPQGRVGHVGLMLSRPTDAIRVIISRLPTDAVAPFLEELGCDAVAAGTLSRLTAELLEIVDHVKVCLDVGPRVYPQIGLEAMFMQMHGLDPRWRALLDFVVERGMCRPEKRDALLGWPGTVQPRRATMPWPADLLLWEIASPASAFGVFDRRLSHIKVVYRPGAPLSAKAYFGYGYLTIDKSAPPDWLPRNPSQPSDQTSTRDSDATLGLDRRESRSVREAIEAGIRFLLGVRNQAGRWRDFYDVDRPQAADTRVTGYASDEWVTAYVGAALAALDSPAAREGAREAWRLLLHRRGERDGWGYHGQLPVDADSTAWGLRLAERVGGGDHPRAAAARAFVRAQMDPSGGVRTYRAVDCPALAAFLKMDGPYDGWCAVHACVTAAVAADPELGPAARPFLRERQLADGHWTGHWWDDDEYATFHAAAALASTHDDQDTARVNRAAAWALSRLDAASGAVWSDAHGGPSAFATALAIQTALLGARTHHAAVENSVEWLTATQRGDGSWPASARLRVPAPPAVDPLSMPELGLTYLDIGRVFTTATTIAALDAYSGGLTP
jgi:hypothetical protein